MYNYQNEIKKYDKIGEILGDDKKRGKSGSSNRALLKQDQYQLPIILQENKLKFEDKYRMLMMERENKTKQLEERKDQFLQKQIEDEDCTF